MDKALNSFWSLVSHAINSHAQLRTKFLLHPGGLVCPSQPTYCTAVSSPNMVSEGIRSMLAIDCSWKKDKYATSAASAVHEPLSSPVTAVILDSWDRYEWQGSSDALTDWMNERWRKTGFQISREVVCFTLRYHGRKARMGLGDHTGGTFSRGELSR